MNERLPLWAPEAVLAVLVLAAGLVEAVTTTPSRGGGHPALVLVALATAAVVGISRRYPGAALACVWVIGGLQSWYQTRVLLIEFAFVVVAFSTARWGRPLTVLASGLSIPAAAVCGVLLVRSREYFPYIDVAHYRTLVDTLYRFGDTWVVGAGVLGMSLLGVPWLAGLALRFSDRARESHASQTRAEGEAARAQVATEQAREIARLRDDQARLARDVHDVVGHSLAVILAQAESAQYLADADTEKLKVTMQHIATSARSSLQDVRHVLAAESDELSAAQPRPLDTLVDGVRASGHEVVSREVGTPQPLPPELEVIAYRVLQEMLTNAIKHGRRDEPVFVERHWPDGSERWLAGELRIEVRNVVDEAPPTDETQPVNRVGDGAVGGQGLTGMRCRLESAGGRLDVRRREEANGISFTTTAWVPVRTVSS